MKRIRLEQGLLVVILLAYIAYAAVFILKTSFVFEGERYFTLFDDAMISMQFAKNLANGQGLVWNAGGERVEGFTNPLWVVFLAGLHLFPVAASKISLLVQISGGVFFLGALIFIYKISHRISHNAWIGLASTFICAFYYPFSTWSLYGMEVSVLLLIITAGVWIILRQQGEQKHSFSPAIYLLIGFSTLIRTDMVVPYLVIWIWHLWFDRVDWRKHLVWGLVVLVVFLGGQTIWRWFYYGELLPNTYYLKMEGFPLELRLLRGIYVFFKFAWNFGAIFALLPVLIILFRRDRWVGLLALVFMGQVAYSVYVGGDAWEHRGGSNRFISLGMPFFFILFTITSIEIFKLIKAHAEKTFSGKAARWVQPGVMTSLLVFLGLALINFNTLIDGTSLKQWLLMDRNIFAPGSERYARDGLLLKQVTKPQAVLAVAAAGNSVYFSGLNAIDLLGKVDKAIARMPNRLSPKGNDLVFMQPGHLKWDYAHSIGQGKPDVIEDVIINTEREVEPYLVDYVRMKVNGHTIYFLKNSPNILWDKFNNGEYKP